jgi:AcrR family transcriptional regulator
MASETERKKTLIERILQVFFSEGISSQTMEGVADKIGVSKRTLYKYFPNKDKLIDSVLMSKLESVEAQMLELMGSGLPLTDRIVGFFNIVETAIKPMANKLIRDVMTNVPWIWAKIDKFRHDRLLIHLKSLFEEGKEKGLLREDLKIELVLPIYIAIIEQIGRPEFFLQNDVQPSMVIKTLISILLGGILSDAGRKEFAKSDKGGIGI